MATIAPVETHPLTAYRNRHNLTTSDFGKEVGVTRITVWRWEERKRFPEPKLWPRIRQATGGELAISDFDWKVLA